MNGSDDGIGRRTFLKATGAAGGAVALSGVAGAADAGDDGHEFLVGVSAATGIDSMERDLPPSAEVVRRNDDLGFARVRIDGVASTYDRIGVESEVARLDGVKYTEEDAVVHFESVPEDAAASVGSPGANDPRFDEQYAPQQVDAPDAWEVTEGESATISVIDTGIDYEHPDLQDRFEDPVGKNFGDGDPEDPSPRSNRETHGTHVAGIAAATTGNAQGVAGISNARLLACRTLVRANKSVVSMISDAIQWSTDQGADVINMSLGLDRYSRTLENAIVYAVNGGALPVCSAGNDSERGTTYPAPFSECMAISAVDENEEFTRFSNYGEDIDVTAPGLGVLSTYPDERYGTSSGTSMACPAVVGVAALAKAANPGVSATELRRIVEESAVDIGLPEDQQGAGLVNAANAVQAGGGGGRPDCGETVTTTHDGEVDGSFDDAEFEYGTQMDDPCGITLSLTGDGDETGYLDLDLYATFDGRTPTTVDHDLVAREYGAEQEIEIGDQQIDDSTTLGILVDCYSGTGTFELTLAESGQGDGGGGGGGLNAEIDAPAGPVEVGEEVEFDALDSTPEADIESYDWEMGDGSLGFGRYVTHTYAETGEYTVELTVSDDHFGDGATDVDTSTVEVVEDAPDDGPVEAVIDIQNEDIQPGDWVSMSAADSESEAGSITRYEWSFDNGETDTGIYTTTVYDEAGEYTVELTVEDSEGNTGSAVRSVFVGDDGGGQCGVSKATDENSDRIGRSQQHTYTYTAQLDDTCQVTFDLSGPENADFDLYVNLDGSIPSLYDYDRRSATMDANQTVVVEDASPGQEFGVMIDAWDGEGDYEFAIEELGQ